MKDKIFNIAIAMFFLISVWLLFADLSDQALWNDEAFAAVIARNTMKFGYPASFDGMNYLYPDSPDFNWPGSYICRVDPWLPIYTTALSFKLFGISTLSARLPFIIVGFLTLIMLFIFCVHYVRSRQMGFISVLLLATSVPFLLHVRQARYYGLVILLSLAMFYFYNRIVEKSRGYFWLGAVCTTLTLAHHVAFVPMFGAIWLMALFLDRGNIRWKRFIIMSIVPLVFFSAWVLFSLLGMSDASAFPVNSTLLQIKKNLEFQLRTINSYFIPIAFWLVVIIASHLFKKHSFFRPSEKEKKIFFRIALILMCNIAFFSIFGIRTMRYYIQYLPFLCLIEAFILFRIFQWKKALAIFILFLAIFTNLLARPNPAKFKAYFMDYIYEITHEYTGPLEALCDYLDLHAKPGERIKIVKGDLTVMFYHPELVVLNDARYFKKSYPEWIVVRRYWNPIFEDIWREKPGIEIEEGYLNVLDRYDKVLLPAVDSIRENVPDNLKEHFFKSPEVTPENQMFVYHLKPQK